MSSVLSFGSESKNSNTSDSFLQNVLQLEGINIFSPPHRDASDFIVSWVGAPVPGVDISILKESIQWVMTEEKLRLPRARMQIRVQEGDHLQIQYAGLTQTFDSKNPVKEFSVALISGSDKRISILVKRNGKIRRGFAEIRYLRSSDRPPVVRADSSCSPYSMSFKNVQLSNSEWIYVSCLKTPVMGEEHWLNRLEVNIFWEGRSSRSETILVNGFPTRSGEPYLKLQQGSEPGKVRLESQGSSFDLEYRVADRFHLAFLGAGLGPYSYRMSGPREDFSTIAPILTLYGSFYFDRDNRIVIFDALALHKSFYSDLGIYFHTKQFQVFVNRFRMNLLLGGHSILFRHGGETTLKFSAPQGFEFTFYDFLKTNHALNFGLFLQPTINESHYYNLWVRWGPPWIFGEINYIAWKTGSESGLVSSKSLGVTVGMPLARFF